MARPQLNRILPTMKSFVKDILDKPPTKGPDFIVAGMTRSGTTYLYHVLKQHPDIFMPRSKELHYFNHEGRYKEDLQGYLSNFRGYIGQKIIGEITPSYIELENYYDKDGNLYYYRRNRSSETPIEKIRRHYPDVKIIVSVRDPLSRAISFYSKNWLQGRLTNSLEEEILQEYNSGNSCLNLIYKNRYDIYLENLFRFFPRESVHVIVFEEWIKNQDTALNDLMAFLGIKPLQNWDVLGQEKQNHGEHYGKDSGLINQTSPKELGKEVASLFKKELMPTKQYIEALIGHNVPWDL